jgi:hypothetical protein
LFLAKLSPFWFLTVRFCCSWKFFIVSSSIEVVVVGVVVGVEDCACVSYPITLSLILSHNYHQVPALIFTGEIKKLKNRKRKWFWTFSVARREREKKRKSKSPDLYILCPFCRQRYRRTIKILKFYSCFIAIFG